MKGFTLVEISIVLAILALLIGGMLIPISAQIEQQKIVDTRQSIDLIREALVGYAVAYGYLPCPAISATNGQEGRTSGTCASQVGFVPWVTLGTPQLDAWGNLFGYRVSPQFSNQPITLTSSANITILTRAPVTFNLVTLSNCSEIPAVVLSHGKDGFGATSAQGIAQLAPPSQNVDEITNWNGTVASPPCSGSNYFVSRTPVQDSTVNGGAFDDIVDWLSPYVLFDRMVSGGKLP